MTRLILWWIVFSPLVLMCSTLVLLRWRKYRGQTLCRDFTKFALLSLGLGAWVAYDFYQEQKGLVPHVHLQQPWTLALLIPVYALILWLQTHTLSGITRGRMWTAFLLRGSILNLLVLALCGLQMVVEKDTLRVLFALDVSKSVPIAERQRAVNFIRKTLAQKAPEDEVGLLIFGGTFAPEPSPSKLPIFPDADKFKGQVAPDTTDISHALRRALNTFDEDSRRRLVLFTDGRENAGNAAEELKRVVSMGVDVWVVPLTRGNDAEVLIEKIVLPSELLWEQTFDCNVYVISNITTKAKVHLYLGDKAGANPEPQLVDLIPGKNRVTFSKLKMHSGGAKEVRAVIEALGDDGKPDPTHDTLAENNEAYAFTDVQTNCRVLVLTNDVSEVKYLIAALEGEKITLDVRSGASIPENPEAFRAYDCIVLANLARPFLSDQQMRVIESCVKDQGAGLVMIGGEQSFGAGGYLNTPIEEALPVQMDLKNDRVMPSGALNIVLHTCEFGEGNAWGKKISKAAINVLSPQDYVGLLFFDHTTIPGEQWCFKPQQVSNKARMFSLIDKCDPGDMPTLDPIVAMAVKSVANLSNISLKHCIIITDGDPCPPSPTTIAAAKNAKVTVSTITIFPHGGGDVSAMKNLAAETGGRYYSADDPKKLPQIFIKEAAIVRKSLIRADEKGIPVGLSAPGPTLKEFGSHFPDVFAFVVTQIKERAELQLYSTVEGSKVPILASWNYGLGKSIAFTSDCTNRWGAKWVEWSSYHKFWSGLFTWVSRARVPSNHTVTTLLEGNTARVIVEGTDAKGDYLNFARLTGNVVDPSVARTGEGENTVLNFSMSAPGRYEATFPVTQTGAYSVAVIDQSNPKKPNTIVTGLAHSYSPEFLYLTGDDVMLAKLGEIATGKNEISRLKDLAKLEKTNLAELGLYAHDQPPTRQPTDLFWTMILIALCLFPFDVAVRRLAIDPERAYNWLNEKWAPILLALRLKKKKLQEAAAEALIGSAKSAAPTEIVPSGSQSRAAQNRYEQAGGSAEAQSMDLNPNANPDANKPVVGGTKISEPDGAASDYTRALLKAKKRAK